MRSLLPSLIRGLVLCTALSALASCGEDETPAATAKTAGGGDAGATADGLGDAAGDSAGQADAAVDAADPLDTLADAAQDTGTAGTDASSPPDIAPDIAKVDTGPTCGDGTCNTPDETVLNCAKDCAGGANCGDGQCLGAQENAFSCKADCSVGTSDLVGCIMGKCTTEVLQCLQSQPCTESLGCLQGCGNDFACLGQCGAGLDSSTQQILGATVLCGQQQGCFGLGGSGGSCGDNTCTAPVENPWTCEKDCPKPSCGDGKCGAPWENFLTCKGDCPAPKCGDGNCEGPVESVINCAQDCKPSTCGDKKCDSPAETAANCLQDCAATAATAAACLATKCGKEGLGCGLDLKCAGASLCAGKCADKACFVECAKELPAGSGKLFTAWQDCALKNACINP